MNRGKIHSVSSVNQYIKNMFSREYALAVVFVRGEVSNCKYHSSGHIYFSLKDASSQIACVMFRGDRGGLDFRMENGQEIVVGGSIQVYERDGKYQLYAKKIVLAGDGVLSERYEQLKRKLQALGYFEEERKLPIPKYVKKLGIVTASTGAAIQDIMNISARRNPYVQLVLYPAKVQGEGAAETIVEGIRILDEMGMDVIIIGRGGGSMEDLWAFNEEIVAEAVFRCRTPVISAVGHETDFTIADFVADLRAPTPSAAAELAVCDIRQVLAGLYDYKDRLARCMLQKTENMRDRILFVAERMKFYNPQNQVLQRRQYFSDAEEKLELHRDRLFREKKHALALLAGRLDSVSPLKRLQSGFAYVSDAEGCMLDSVGHVRTGDRLHISLIDGRITAVTESVERDERKEGKVDGTGKDHG